MALAVAVAPEQAQAVLAGTQLPLPLLRLLLSVSRGANFSNPNCCHKSLLPRVVCFGAAIWFAAADAFKFNSQRKCLGKRKKKCASQIGHGAAAAQIFAPSWLVSSVPLSTCRIRNASYQLRQASALACGAQSAQCISLKRFYEPQGAASSILHFIYLFYGPCLLQFNGPFWAHSAWQLSVFRCT